MLRLLPRAIILLGLAMILVASVVLVAPKAGTLEPGSNGEGPTFSNQQGAPKPKPTPSPTPSPTQKPPPYCKNPKKC